MPVSFIRQRSTYVGPGDIVPGAAAAYLLRAYNAAYANGSNKAINVRRASDNTTQDILILANGNLDVATANTFAGTDATGTGAITGTTLTFTGGHVGDTVTGSGVMAGTYIVSGSSPTWTVNNSQTVASTTLTLTFGLYVTEWYDQSGNGNHATQATAGSQPQLLTDAFNGLPVVAFNGLNNLNTAMVQAYSSPVSYSFIANDVSTDANQILISGFTGTAGQNAAGFLAGGDEVFIYAGNLGLATATSGAWHSIQAVSDLVDSVINVDGSETTVNAGTGAASISITLGDNGNLGVPLTASVAEIAMWEVALNGPERSALHFNDKTYWGTP